MTARRRTPARPIPLAHLPNIAPHFRGDHASNIVFLSADAFGVLPPIAKLTP